MSREDDSVREEWRAVAGYEGLYEVSDLGRVRRLWRRAAPRVLTEHFARNDPYLSVTLFRDGLRRRERIHRLVARAFLPASELPVVRHLDDDKLNNRPSNLAHGTQRDNMLDVVRNGNNVNASKTSCKRGHEFTPENTKRRRDRPRARICRECANDDSRAWRRR